MEKEACDNKVTIRDRLGFIAGNIPAAYRQKLAVIRDCSGHLGQAFSEDEKGRKPISGCYLCQMTLKYRVADEGPDMHHAIQKFELGDRDNNPASCVEVLCSALCFP